MATNRNIAQWLLVVLWISFIFVLSGKIFAPQNTLTVIGPIIRWLLPGMSAKTLNVVNHVLRKFWHVVEYYVLGLLLFHAFRKFIGGLQPWRWTVPAVIVLLLCAGSDELHQSFVSGRNASVVDVSIDAVSGVLAQMISTLRHRVAVQASDHRDVSTKT